MIEHTNLNQKYTNIAKIYKYTDDRTYKSEAKNINIAKYIQIYTDDRTYKSKPKIYKYSKNIQIYR